MPEGDPSPLDGRSRETAVPRPSARVVLLDAENRVLLIRSEFDGRILWFTPGGGIEPGESPEEAAHRELREETGLDAAEVRWEGPCWLRDWTWHWEARHRWVASHEHFFLARFPGPGPALPNGNHAHTQEEVLQLHEWRWWSLDELRAEAAPTSPACLLDVLPALIGGGCPAEPLPIGR